ncbi:RNA polymerase sigma-70 factor [Imtechella halotolerans]|uniref:ECF subfamily RNA polymerase sigma-24 subunit n=1 Tax=Imtechella halotolerans K1 TaxID=946077 RepID=I0WC83_9FLAO|nr:RNA polymerase sigma-70 factor [Imtechella halotolerans]EID73999.1 ECF subfamily RNA polymerase sigma-24 subunit [Imtechella halotolerans K1]WMQ63769.1 RNA polymerase sigma-70 factor [Imtechella halotolerans]
MIDEKSLLTRLKHNDDRAFEIIYNELGNGIFHYCNSRINDLFISEEIVQEVFLSLWNKRSSLEITTSLKSYLFTAAKYQILNHIRSEKVRKEYATNLANYLLINYENPTEDLIAVNDLKALIDEIVESLPKKCQLVFKMSRFENLSIQEISKEMNISTRTVENHLTKALKHIRQELEPLAFVCLLYSLAHFSNHI